ncbi:hypothetical protein RHMOL_Rhmol10G0146400 [Rhododendron molle]|uniref:Uncharacterized protein n=1 Tax=Rhododendron molle TaxID=49168 RepID=A0ACC0M2C7_RHOML|nr:hypothetical protein RHMOL_Rhmol10G0146400 [Rhododendron molle]
MKAHADFEEYRRASQKAEVKWCIEGSYVEETKEGVVKINVGESKGRSQMAGESKGIGEAFAIRKGLNLALNVVYFESPPIDVAVGIHDCRAINANGTVKHLLSLEIRMNPKNNSEQENKSLWILQVSDFSVLDAQTKGRTCSHSHETLISA